MTQENLIDLPTNYKNIQDFCNSMQPHIAKDSISTDVIRKVLFIGKGWRLSNTGHFLLTKKFKSYKSINEKNKTETGKIILYTDVCCNGPWSLLDGVVTVFDSILHFELQMVNGDLNAFINFKSP